MRSERFVFVTTLSAKLMISLAQEARGELLNCRLGLCPPNKSLKLRSVLRGAFVDASGFKEGFQASNNATATPTFILSYNAPAQLSSRR